jgi:hypothetical protein
VDILVYSPKTLGYGGSMIFDRREPKSVLGQVFDLKVLLHSKINQKYDERE